MRIGRWHGMALVIMLLGGVLAPSAALAQAGFYVTPSLSIGEVYDDNIFSRATQRKNDFIARFTPTVQAGDQSEPLTLLGRYSFDAERYENHPELTKAQMRQRASIEFRYLPIRPLTLSINGNYTKTQTPQDLNVLTGVEAERRRAQSYSFAPSIAYRFDPRTSTIGAYTFTRSELAGSVSTDTHTANWDLNRQITLQDIGTLGYTFRHFIFGGGLSAVGDTTTTSHVGSLGWTHEFTPLTRMILRGGARVTKGSADPEVSAEIIHTLQSGTLSFTYSRSQNTNIGQSGTVDTESFSASITHQPLRFLHTSATPSYYRSTRGTSEVKVYGLSLQATYQIAEWLNLVGSYRFNYQQGIFNATTAPSGGSGDIYHNIALLSFVATYPYRVY